LAIRLNKNGWVFSSIISFVFSFYCYLYSLAILAISFFSSFDCFYTLFEIPFLHLYLAYSLFFSSATILEALPKLEIKIAKNN